MGKKIWNILQYFIFLGGGIFLVWWQFHKMTAEQIIKFKFALSTANYWLLIPVVVMSLASHLSRSMRWKILLQPMGYRPSLFNTFGVTMVGYLANSFVPRLGEILKCTMLSKYEKIPVQKLIGTVVIERLFDVVCYLVFICITVLIQYKLVGDFVKTELMAMMEANSGLPLWAKALLPIVVLAMVIWLLRFLFKKYAHSKFIQRLKNFFVGLKEGVSSIKRLQQRRLFLLHTLFIWTMYLLQIYIGFSAIQDVAHLGLDAACAVLTLATLAMILTPGGLGTFPTAIFLVLVLYKIDPSTGEAFGWLMWGTTTFIILFFGLLFLGLLFFINKKNKQNTLLTQEVSSL